MDAGMAVRPMVSVASAHAQPAVAIAPTAPTVLPATQVVAPVAHNAAARNEPRRAAVSDHTTHDAIIDPETREVVYRVLDAHTRQVIHQIPDQAMLRMQAYARAEAARAMADGENPVKAVQAAVQHIDTLT